MKTAFILIATLFMSSAFADAPVPVRRPVIIQAKEKSITRVQCPKGKKCVTVLRYQLNVTYGALGCLDKIEAKAEDGGYTKDGRRIIELTGVNYRNPRSSKVKCFAQPTKTFVYRLEGSEGPEDVKVIERQK